MAQNKNLHEAKTAQKDEFYTQMTDIEIEMNAYLEYDENVFRDKVIFCNCDDPYESNFFKYFALRFNDFGLKQLIATCYSGSPVAGTQLSLFDEPTAESQQKTAYKVIINEVKDINGDGAVDLEDIKRLLADEKNVATELKGNGDFRSDECIDLLKQSDIVVTNPPFSLFREYLATLVEHNKKFIIIGNVNAVTYKEVFPLIKDNKMWLGASIHSGDREFRVPDNYPLNAAGYRIDDDGIKYIRVKGVRWYTNLPTNDRYEELQLMTKADNLRFNRQLKKSLDTLCFSDYPKYDNYDAIEVPITVAIPSDYKGVMGVPITFLDKYCPEQFEILGLLQSSTDEQAGIPNLRFYNDFKEMRQDMSFTGSSGAKANGNPVLKGKSHKGNFLFNESTKEYVHSVYARIVIRYTEQWVKDHQQDFKER